MLPRLRPRVFYDLVVEWRSCAPARSRGTWSTPTSSGARNSDGPPRGASRRGRLPRAPFRSTATRTSCAAVLGKTLGVPLFQEQACASPWRRPRFSGGEANG
ncbi:MAG: hypothetical protein WDM92_12265 [Caulobacteraceae bacterium]